MARASIDSGTAKQALRRMADAEPELAARMVIHSLPAAAAPLSPALSYRLEVEGLGAWRVAPNGGCADVSEVPAGADLDGDQFAIETDVPTLARIAAGRSPLGPFVRGRIHIRGKRRKALGLRRLTEDAGPRKLAELGAPVDPDLLYQSLPYAIDPEWTRGYNFTVAYELGGEGGGTWHVKVADGTVTSGRGLGGEPESIVRIDMAVWMQLLRDEMTPAAAMRRDLTSIEGQIHPVTMLGRWIERADGRDGAEQERETKQRALQASRAGSWGSKRTTNADTATEAGDPAQPRPRGGLLDYQQLYALWERQNWRAHELDFSIDRDHWAASPAEAQQHTAFSIGSFYVGEERVTADLAPFLLAAPTGEIEAFLATQIVDEMRHAVFFDRWAAEVMALESGEMRGRLKEIEDTMLGPWHFLFDDSLRDVADRIKADPDNLELFVEGITIYHMVTEGVMAMTGQRAIISYTSEHSLYPGFNEGFRLVERDEHRHIAFGVRFLKEVCEEQPEMKTLVNDTIERLLPRAAEAFAPPETTDPAEFVSYGFHSSQLYGFAYEALKRRMSMIGIEVAGPERLMPGPINPNGFSSEPVAETVGS